MKILIVTQYFWPENFRVNDLAVDLAKRGHEITVLTGKPNYPGGNFFKGYSMFGNSVEYWNGIKIYRSALIPRGKGGGARLFLNYLSFAVFASIKAFFIKKKFDRIFVYGLSPITVGIPAIVTKRKTGAPIFFYVQDLWPDSLSAAGGVKNKLVLAVVAAITRYIYKHSLKVLVQSKGFIPYILKQGVPQEKLIYYPNTSESFYKAVEQKEEYLSRLPEGFKVMFAGNIGKGQSFDTLLNASKKLKNENINVKWIILGDGRMKNWVIKRVGDLGLEDCFFLIGSFSPDTMPYFFACADALLVSLKKEPIFALTIPSKIQSYLACGKPLIGSLDGEGARIIEEAKAGFTAPSENSSELSECIKRLFYMDEEKRKSLGNNARTYYEKEFDRGILLDRLELILRN
jgi:glycosyltransferase involved in cell wall biosynthesis